MSKRALISVTDKSGVVEFARELNNLGYEVISTGNTFKILKENGVKAITIDEVTKFPEMLDGRVKTLNPYIHGGILYKRDEKSHVDTVNEYNIGSIDLVVVNLYDFEGTLKAGKSHEEIIENIDIGGPSMIRSAAKNYKDVTVFFRDTEGNLLNDQPKLRAAFRLYADTSLKDIGSFLMNLSQDEATEFKADLTDVIYPLGEKTASTLALEDLYTDKATKTYPIYTSVIPNLVHDLDNEGNNAEDEDGEYIFVPNELIRTIVVMVKPEEASVKKALEAIDGVESASADRTKNEAVAVLSKEVSDEVLKAAVEAKDYKVIGIE